MVEQVNQRLQEEKSIMKQRIEEKVEKYLNEKGEKGRGKGRKEFSVEEITTDVSPYVEDWVATEYEEADHKNVMDRIEKKVRELVEDISKNITELYQASGKTLDQKPVEKRVKQWIKDLKKNKDKTSKMIVDVMDKRRIETLASNIVDSIIGVIF